MKVQDEGLKGDCPKQQEWRWGRGCMGASCVLGKDSEASAVLAAVRSTSTPSCPCTSTHYPGSTHLLLSQTPICNSSQRWKYYPGSLTVTLSEY